MSRRTFMLRFLCVAVMVCTSGTIAAETRRSGMPHFNFGGFDGNCRKSMDPTCIFENSYASAWGELLATIAFEDCVHPHDISNVSITNEDGTSCGQHIENVFSGFSESKWQMASAHGKMKIVDSIAEHMDGYKKARELLLNQTLKLRECEAWLVNILDQVSEPAELSQPTFTSQHSFFIFLFGLVLQFLRWMLAIFHNPIVPPNAGHHPGPPPPPGHRSHRFQH